MAVTLGSRHAADEEAQAEVEVLNSRLEKTSQLTKKIQASLSRLETSGKSVQDAIGPIYGNTQRLQVMGRNIDGVLGAIERIRQPSDTKNNEEDIIRLGPDKAGLSPFLSSLKRVNKALSELKASNLKSNQQAAAELTRLLKSGNQQLERVFDKTLSEDVAPIQTLQYVTKANPFPLLPEEKVSKLSLIHSFLASGTTGQEGEEPPSAEIYAKIRGPYLTGSLADLSFGVLSSARKKNADAMYKPGSNTIDTYVGGMEGLFIAEYTNICAIFTKYDWARVFNMTCRNAMSELTKMLRELDMHIKSNLNTDCYLGYETMELISRLSSTIDDRTGELKPLFATALKPIRDTSKWSFWELLEDSKRRLGGIQILPPDGSALPITTEIITRLQTMAIFLRPVEGLMYSLGDNGWKSNPLLKKEEFKDFNLAANGKEIFAHYCEDTIAALIQGLGSKSKMLLKGQMVQGAFMANNHAVVNRVIRTSDLEPLLATRMSATLDKWQNDSRKLYLREWDDACRILLDQTVTGRGRPTSGGATDSAAIIKAMSSKEKDALKEKWKQFNTTFDDLLARHKSLSLEREVRELLAKEVQKSIGTLYARFWDRYHEVDKGKGKYVKYDKASINAVLVGLM